MTDNEIIKALECHTITMKCGECPCDNAFIGGDVEINVAVNNNCFKSLGRDAINLIKRQQAEIKALKMDKEQLEIDISNALGNLDHMTQLYEGATKEFADRLKSKTFQMTEYDEGGFGCEVYVVKTEEIDNTIEEMAGANNG